MSFEGNIGKLARAAVASIATVSGAENAAAARSPITGTDTQEAVIEAQVRAQNEEQERKEALKDEFAAFEGMIKRMAQNAEFVGVDPDVYEAVRESITVIGVDAIERLGTSAVAAIADEESFEQLAIKLFMNHEPERFDECKGALHEFASTISGYARSFITGVDETQPKPEPNVRN